jgi:vacuolar protein sorting-associated protein 35
MEDQEKILEDTKKLVKENAYFMKQELDNANLRFALRHASSMLAELRTSSLAPRNYYILFMAVFDEMRGKTHP